MKFQKVSLNLSILIFICFLLSAPNAFGESRLTLTDSIKSKKDTAKVFNWNENPKNVVKVNLFSLPIKNMNLNYERALTKFLSVEIGARYLLRTDLSRAFGKPGVKLSGWSVTPEFRFYLSKRGSPKGFYIGPYFRYRNYHITYETQIPMSNGALNGAHFRGYNNALMGGIQLGAQFLIKNRVSIDWWILGFGMGSQKVGIVATSDQPVLTQADIAAMTNDVLTNIESLPPIIKSRLNFNIDLDKVDLHTRYFSPTIRLPGLCIGYSF